MTYFACLHLIVPPRFSESDLCGFSWSRACSSFTLPVLILQQWPPFSRIANAWFPGPPFLRTILLVVTLGHHTRIFVFWYTCKVPCLLSPLEAFITAKHNPVVWSPTAWVHTRLGKSTTVGRSLRPPCLSDLCCCRTGLIWIYLVTAAI